MKLKIVVCDDEEIYRSAIVNYVERWTENTGRKDCVTVQLYSSGEDLLYDLEGGTMFNLLFLDIEFPGEQSGLLTAKTVYSKDPYSTIVFITNYSEYACSGYEVNALRYIVKPIIYEKIKECLDITWHKFEMLTADSVILNDSGTLISLPIKSFVYAESFGHTLSIQTAEGNVYHIRSRLSDYITNFPSDLVFRCHRSYAISLMYIRKITHSEITLLDNTTIPLSNKYKKELYAAFMHYHQG